MLLTVRSRSTGSAEDPADRLRASADVEGARKPVLALALILAAVGYLRSFLGEAAAASPAADRNGAVPDDPGTAAAPGQTSPATEMPEAAQSPELSDSPAGYSGPGAGGMPGGSVTDLDIPAPGLPAEAPSALPPAPPMQENGGPAGEAAGAAGPARAAGVGAPSEAEEGDAAAESGNPADAEAGGEGVEASVPADPAPPATAAAQPGAVARFLGSEGNDRIAATDLADDIRALGGDDLILALGGDDIIDAGAGNDRVHAGAGADLVLAGEGHDIVFAGTGDDTVFGGAGDDRIFGEAGRDDLFGEDGNDLIDGGAGDDFIDGGAGDDELHGGDGADAIVGGLGRDLIFAGAGDDLVDGEEDDDSLFGGAGNDILFGGAGNDRLDGGTGADRLYGGAGDDWLVVSADMDDDVYVGGAGQDLLDLSAIVAPVTVDFGAGIVSGDDIGQDRFEDIEAVRAGQGDDHILFAATPVRVEGGAGADCFDFTALPAPSADPVLTRFTITDFEAGDHLRIGQFRYHRDLDARALRDKPDAAPAVEEEGLWRAFGRQATESFEDRGLKLSFVNRAEADRIETMLRLDLDGDGTWDCEIELIHADLPSRCDDDLAA